jgi:GNAT superfamily N-acetyltransferase
VKLYKEYLKEREGTELVEGDFGFATYKIDGKVCYIKDLYIVPEKRKLGLASKIADDICALAKQNGCDRLLGSVSLEDPNADANSRVLTAYGMKMFKTVDSMVYFTKEI